MPECFLYGNLIRQTGEKIRKGLFLWSNTRVAMNLGDTIGRNEKFFFYIFNESNVFLVGVKWVGHMWIFRV